MKDRPEWMSIHALQILRAMGDPDIVTILSPSVIATNLGIHRTTVSRTLSDFVDRGLVEKHADGYYELTDEGRALLEEIEG